VLADADGVVEDLVNQDLGMTAIEVVPGQGNNKPARYYLSTKLTYRMLVNNLRKTITDGERDQVLAEFAEQLSNSGPFRKKIFIASDLDRTTLDVLSTAGIDEARTTRLVLLDSAQFSLRNGMERDTLSALQAALGLGSSKERLSVEWASSAVYAVVNTQRRTLARSLATEYLARLRALAAPEVQTDDELKAAGGRELVEAKDKVEKAIKRAYQHVVFLSQPDPSADRLLGEITLDDDNQSALDGTQVWKALVECDKAFDSGQFTGKALLHNLREQDYGRPLSEVRDSFWNAPRLPLLHSGERDLQNAIYDAVRSEDLIIVDGSGQAVAVTDPGQVNLASVGLRLARPVSTEVNTGDGADNAEANRAGATDPTGPSPFGGGPQSHDAKGSTPDEKVDTETAEKYVAFPLLGSLLDDPVKVDGLAQVFRTLYSILDSNQASYAQGTLQLVLAATAAEKLVEQIRALGLNVTMRDQ
jgi:hypothetical protein